MWLVRPVSSLASPHECTISIGEVSCIILYDLLRGSPWICVGKLSVVVLQNVNTLHTLPISCCVSRENFAVKALTVRDQTRVHTAEPKKSQAGRRRLLLGLVASTQLQPRPG